MQKRTDSEIQQAVMNEINWDRRVTATEVGVEVDDAIVTLTGTVDSWAKRVAAEDAAHAVAGVLDVANDVKVKARGTATRNDTEIAAAVRSALEWDVFVDDARIRSTVSDGFVTLEGDVDLWSERDAAEQAIRNLVGVRGVTSKIAVKPAKLDRGAVLHSIEAALERRAERDAKRISVEVHDGQVTLTGVVHSWSDKQAALGAARGTPGVRDIADHLRVEP